MTELFVIEKLAAITQYQDLGRFGQLHQGLSHSGAMDGHAFAINQHLLGNHKNATQLEIAPGGLRLKALNDCTIAISGAYLTPTLNDKPLINFCSTLVKKGDILSFGFAKVGQFAYLGVVGGFSVTPFLNSCATTKRLGIYPSGELQRNSKLCGSGMTSKQLQGAPRQSLPNYRDKTIHIFPAFQYAQFSKKAIQQMESQHFTIQSSDRMGTRLSAQNPIQWQGAELLSEGLIPGTVQIPPDGHPIVLQKDAQSIGGYPKIGVVTTKSLSLLAQKKAGETVRFVFRQ